MMRTIIATDFDGTLTTSDTLLEFIRYAKGSVRCLAGFLLYSPFIVLMMLKMYPNWKAKQKIFSHFFRGMTIDSFNVLCHDFARDNRHLLRQGGLEMMNKAKADGTEVVIVSASIDNWVQPFFPETKVLGTQIEVIDGIVTGRFLSKNCYGKEKVNRLLEMFPDRNSYRLVAYGDSGGDRAMLAFADESHFRPWRQ